MQYLSTRGLTSPMSFKEAVMMGLATDGGLLLPATLPAISDDILRTWQRLSYQELAHAVMGLFITDIGQDELASLINRSYATFTHREVTPLVKQGGLHILELFHGPTFAFKDVALQFLGNVFARLLAESGEKMNILGATSGDTGSAAIYGVRGKERINIFIIHPHKRVSAIQELQMTTVTAPNVFNIALRGTFDDGQAIVKTIFNDIPFKEKHRLGAVNSINWARILAQVVYYVYSYLRVLETEGKEEVIFSVPTGNFGDIFAGYVAKKLLPAGRIARLLLATNENDLLTRFISSGDYSAGRVTPTMSPSMDIQVASNFERYLYYLLDQDPVRTREAMAGFAQTGRLSFAPALLARVQADFSAKRVTEAETMTTIKTFFQETGYVLDPHTAVGVNAANSFNPGDMPIICLATAHPAKFNLAVTQAIDKEPDLPEAFRNLSSLPTRCAILDADVGAIKDFIETHAL